VVLQERRKAEKPGLNVVFRQQCDKILMRLGGPAFWVEILKLESGGLRE